MNNGHFVAMHCTNGFSKFCLLVCLFVYFSCFVGEQKIQYILNADVNKVSMDQIELAITANNLCDCKNPIITAFKVSVF